MSLLNIIDNTTTPMGARLLRRWMLFPLNNVKAINDRQSVVEYFFKEPDIKDEIDLNLSLIGDLERIISKVAVGRVNPREVNQLKVALSALAPIKKLCEESSDASLKRIGEQINLCELLRERIEKEITSDPPTLLNRGSIINSGINKDLD